MRRVGRWGRGRLGPAMLSALCLVSGCGPGPEHERPDEQIRHHAHTSKSDRPSLSAAERFLDIPPYGSQFNDDSGYGLASEFSGGVTDRASLDEVAGANRGRNRRGVEALVGRLAAIDPEGPDAPQLRATAERDIGLLMLYEGAFAEAEAWLDRATISADDPLVPVGLRDNLLALRGIAALRRGETENCIGCVGPSTCLWPIASGSAHVIPEGAILAADRLAEYLDRRPDDLAIRWVLRLALELSGKATGEELDRVLPLADREEDRSLGRFPNVAEAAGLLAAGPDMAGGSVFDDLDGDGLPDLFWTSFETDLGPRLLLNNGDGTFADASADAGIDGQVLAVNCTHADFDNDGHLDLLLLRGGWEDPAPMTLLRNLGGARFEDVTEAAGLAEPIASQSAAWADFDGDGHLDLFVCGESRGGDLDGSALFVAPSSLGGDDRQRLCRLYRNLGDGTFADVTADAGVANARYAKGACWGDFDDDGRPDLYVSNMAGPNRLYRNLGDGTFEDVAPRVGVSGPRDSFSCLWLDVDNDGHLDLFVADYSADLVAFVADRVGEGPRGSHPRLYRNLGDGTFADVSIEAGLGMVVLPMGSNLADVDGDGLPDLYLATGRPGFSYLMPNLLLRNVDGKRFVDATASSGTGHLQKGHGVSFADFDFDGAPDLFVQLGGAVPGDRSYNALFRNPGHAHPWVSLRLVGARSNRSAIGARIRVDVRDADGSTRSIHRLVSGGSSFGGNSLALPIGLGDASAIESVTIRWPIPGSTPQVLRDVPMREVIEVTEPAD